MSCLSIHGACTAAGFPRKKLTEHLGIPARTLRNNEMGVNSPSGWAKELIIAGNQRMGGTRHEKAHYLLYSGRHYI